MPDDPSTDLVPHEYHPPAILTDSEIDRTYRIAKALALSGMFKDARQAEQAFAKIILGRDLGLSPAQAMTGIYIVEGKPQVSSTMLASFVKQHPHYDYSVVEHTDKACELLFWYDGDEAGTSRFTIDDAERIGLAKKDVWKKYPKNMLFARAMSNGVKWYAPDATNGVPVYVEGEIPEQAMLNAGAGEPPEDGDAVFEPVTEAEVIPGQTSIADVIDGETPPPGAGLPFDPENPDA